MEIQQFAKLVSEMRKFQREVEHHRGKGWPVPEGTIDKLQAAEKRVDGLIPALRDQRRLWPH